MSATDMEFQKGTGPEQLPAGAATEANAQLPTLTASQPDPMAGAPEAAAPAAPEDGAEDLVPAQAADYNPIYQPQSEDEAFLTDPTTRPDEAQWVGTGPQPTLPPAVARQLPALQRAAAEPGASPELQVLVAYLLRRA